MADPTIDMRGAADPAWFSVEPGGASEGTTVLLVEDDPDIRELTRTLLQLAGFAPTVCSTAEAALEQLREQQFDALLTDYMLPNRTGGWLLHQATEEGLIDGTTAMVLTAHPNPPDVNGFEVVTKPCDPDDLVSRLRRRVSGNARPGRTGRGNRAPRPGDGDGRSRGEPIELFLYVNGDSAKMAEATRSVKEAVARFAPGLFSLTIRDLSRNPGHGAADGIACTPALVKRSPGPRTFILGHIPSADVVAELLSQAL